MENSALNPLCKNNGISSSMERGRKCVLKVYGLQEEIWYLVPYPFSLQEKKKKRSSLELIKENIILKSCWYN